MHYVHLTVSKCTTCSVFKSYSGCWLGAQGVEFVLYKHENYECAERVGWTTRNKLASYTTGSVAFDSKEAPLP